MPDYLNPEELLTAPQIINNQGWLKGYYLTIGNIPIKEEDKVKNSGFLHFVERIFVDEEGNPLHFIPEMYRYYALGSYGRCGE